MGEYFDFAQHSVLNRPSNVDRMRDLFLMAYRI